MKPFWKTAWKTRSIQLSPRLMTLSLALCLLGSNFSSLASVLNPDTQETAIPQDPSALPLHIEHVSTKTSPEARMLRSLQIGAYQDITVGEIENYLKENQNNNRAGQIFALGALLVNEPKKEKYIKQVRRLLDEELESLNHTTQYALPSDLPNQFNADDAVFTLTYALVVSGAVEEATDTLAAHIPEPGQRNTRLYAQGVIYQLLHNIGTYRANDVIRDAIKNKNQDKGLDTTLLDNILTDRYYPYLWSLGKRWALIPPEKRNRQDLYELAGKQCGEEQALAIYWMGFLENNPDERLNQRELQRLRELATAPCYYSRHFAIKSLAMRSEETPNFWKNLAEKEQDGWIRDTIVKTGYVHFGKNFVPTALELLITEPSQYVQWELMHGGFEIHQAQYRDHWNLWRPVTLQFHLTFPQVLEERTLTADELEPILTWLETGHRPRDPWVRNYQLYSLAKHVRGDQAKRFLSVFNSHPQRNWNWWILSPLKDPVALPALQYYESLDAPEDQREILQETLHILEETALTSNASPATSKPIGSDPKSFEATSKPIDSEETLNGWLYSQESGH